jgi:hypothetical protein
MSESKQVVTFTKNGTKVIDGVIQAPLSMPNRDFFDKEFHTKMQQDFESIRQRRKALKGRPSEEEMALIAVERVFETFYRRFL